MAREGLMDDCGYHGFDECARYEECCDEAYERGRADAIEDCISIVDGYLVDMPITHDNTIKALCKLKEQK